jgi:hypothetical protein
MKQLTINRLIKPNQVYNKYIFFDTSCGFSWHLRCKFTQNEVKGTLHLPVLYSAIATHPTAIGFTQHVITNIGRN